MDVNSIPDELKAILIKIETVPILDSESGMVWCQHCDGVLSSYSVSREFVHDKGCPIPALLEVQRLIKGV